MSICLIIIRSSHAKITRKPTRPSRSNNRPERRRTFVIFFLAEGCCHAAVRLERASKEASKQAAQPQPLRVGAMKLVHYSLVGFKSTFSARLFEHWKRPLAITFKIFYFMDLLDSQLP
jgi:hypothetical protein